MKRIVICLLSLVLLALPLTALADMGLPSIDAYQVYVGTGGQPLNYTEYLEQADGSWKPFERSAQLQFGDRMTVTDQSGENEWSVQVALADGESFYSFITDAELAACYPVGQVIPASIGQPIASTDCLVNDQTGLNLREGPGTSFDIRLALPYRSRVRAQAVYDKWAYVTTDAGEGWVFFDYLQTIGGTDSSSLSASSVGGEASASQIPSQIASAEPSSAGAAPSVSTGSAASDEASTASDPAASLTAEAPRDGAVAADVAAPQGQGGVGLPVRLILILGLCLGVAVVLSVTAVVIVLLVLRAKNQPPRP